MIKTIPKWENEIKKYDKLILKKLKVEDKYKFIENKKEWEQYKIIQFKFIDEFINNKRGEMYQDIAVSEKENFLEKRTKELHFWYEKIFD